MTTKLSAHFTLEEMIASQVARRLDIDNTPSASIIERLRETALKLEIVRQILGNRPMFISSGYRSPVLNGAIGGSTGSAHMIGYAVDFTCPEYGAPFAVAKFLSEQKFEFDQLICEFTDWVHISFAPQSRREPLTIFTYAQGYLPGIVEVAP